MVKSKTNSFIISTIRVELLSGKILIYPVEFPTKQYVINTLGMNSNGDELIDKIKFIWFQTTFERNIIINVNDVVRITIMDDIKMEGGDKVNYFDNFNILETMTGIKMKNLNEELQALLIDEKDLPAAIIYHRGKVIGKENYYKNPIIFEDLDDKCFGTLNAELEQLLPMRQFLNFLDDDGDIVFIPLKQIIVMEFEDRLFSDEDILFDEDDENEDFDEEDFKLFS